MRIFTSFCLGALLTSNCFAAEPIALATLEWPPYVGSNLSEQGFVSKIVRIAFEGAGFTATNGFFPWERAIAQVIENNAIAFYPGYPGDCEARKTLASQPVGSGPLAFAQNTNKPFTWNTLKDLTNLSIGTVIGYSNTEEFDKMAANKTLNVSPVKDDLSNIVKLHNQRLDAVVIDGNVFQYMQSQRPELKNLELNAKPLSDLPLFVCFKDNEKGKAALEAFNAALAKMDIKQLQKEYLDGLQKK